MKETAQEQLMLTEMERPEQLDDADLRTSAQPRFWPFLSSDFNLNWFACFDYVVISFPCQTLRTLTKPGLAKHLRLF
jgi:hypothetical protein